MPISANQPAPEFALADETGTVRKLTDFRGKAVVLYFYPKDDTPGCTIEACNFRDDYHVYAENGVVILGSARTTANRTPNSGKNSICPSACWRMKTTPFAKLTGFGAEENHGTEYEGVLRTTFLIGPDGMILKVWENVKPDGHSGQVLAGAEKRRLTVPMFNNK